MKNNDWSCDSQCICATRRETRREENRFLRGAAEADEKTQKQSNDNVGGSERKADESQARRREHNGEAWIWRTRWRNIVGRGKHKTLYSILQRTKIDKKTNILRQGHKEQLIYKIKGKEAGQLYNGDKYAEVDHVLVNTVSNNMITDIETSVDANLTSDHYAIKITYRHNLWQHQKH